MQSKCFLRSFCLVCGFFAWVQLFLFKKKKKGTKKKVISHIVAELLVPRTRTVSLVNAQILCCIFSLETVAIYGFCWCSHSQKHLVNPAGRGPGCPRWQAAGASRSGGCLGVLSLLFATAGPQTQCRHGPAFPQPPSLRRSRLARHAGSRSTAAAARAPPPRPWPGQWETARARRPRPPAGYSPRGRRAARQCAEPAMATVREKAAALSLSAVCSPAARPPGTGRGARLGGSGAASARAWWGQLVGEMGLPRRGPGGRSRPAPRRELRARSSVPAPFPAPHRFKSWPLSGAGGGRCFRPEAPSGLRACPAAPHRARRRSSCAAPPPGLGGCGRGACQVPTGGSGSRGDSGGCFCPGSKVKIR